MQHDKQSRLSTLVSVKQQSHKRIAPLTESVPWVLRAEMLHVFYSYRIIIIIIIIIYSQMEIAQLFSLCIGISKQLILGQTLQLLN